MERNQRLLILGAAALAATGLALVLSAPLDGAARTGLGSTLLTGLIIGISVSGIERGIEARRVAAERRRDEEQYEAMLDLARNGLGGLMAAYVWAYWWLLLPYSDDPNFVTNLPAGFRNEDSREVHRGLQWLREMMGADQSWWRDQTLREAADALSFVATDLLERTSFREILTEEGQRQNPAAWQSVQESLRLIEIARERAVERLEGVAQRLAQAGDSQRALRIDGQVEALVLPDFFMWVYAPTLDRLETRDGETELDRPLSSVRTEVAWIVDQLRPDPIAANEYGEPAVANAPEHAVYRWSHLFDVHEGAEGAWDRRFSQGSWLRRIFARAGTDLRARFGLPPVP
ncbi:hypothetical protein [Streptomyces phaeochromogenes]